MSVEGKGQMPAKGGGHDEARRPSALTCPWCESPRVELVGAIGSHLMVAQYICLACRSPFERIRR
jgi:hypothetical protein